MHFSLKINCPGCG